MKKLSMRGEEVNFAYYIEQNAGMPAVGNAMLNARGDQLDSRGNVVKTRAEISAEYHRSQKSVRQVSISSLDSEIFQTPAEAVKKLLDDKKAVKAAPPARKISDAD
jgi:hypothetical protein